MAGRTFRPRRTYATWALGIAGALAYNWWIVLPALAPLPSVVVHGLLSDLEAEGMPHAEVLTTLNLASGVLVLLAVIARGGDGTRTMRRLRGVLAVFALAVAAGALFPYACPEGLDEACRDAEWEFALPLHHYVHMTAGVVEYGAGTVALVLARRAAHAGYFPERARHVLDNAAWILVVAYPLLAVSYLADVLGSMVEIAFFVVFAAMVLVVLLAPTAAEDEVPAGASP